MTVAPLNDKILVQRLEAEDKSAGGIILPDNAKEKPKMGTVLSDSAHFPGTAGSTNKTGSRACQGYHSLTGC